MSAGGAAMVSLRVTSKSAMAAWCHVRGEALFAPGAERGEQVVAQLVGQRLARQAPDRRDRAPQLLEVARAVLAAGDVRLEAAPVARGERALEAVGDELDDLLAAQRPAHAGSSRYPASASRTPARARCSRTRWLFSEMSSATQTSPDGQPSTSRSVMTSRWRSGSGAIAFLIRARTSAASARSSGAHGRGGDAHAPSAPKRSGSTVGSSPSDDSGTTRASRAPRLMAR